MPTKLHRFSRLAGLLARLPGIALLGAGGQFLAAEPLPTGYRIITTEVQPMAFTRAGVVMGFCVEIVWGLQRRVADATAIDIMP